MNKETTPVTPGKDVYRAIAEVMSEVSKEGVSKDRKNLQQGYAFRGIDDLYNALSSIMAKAGLCIIPRMTDRTVNEVATKAGGTLFYTTVRGEFDFVSAKDGSSHTAVTFGEAMDSGDKSTNKAMSAAYKYVCMQVFCIPTEGDNDTENQTHDPAAKPATKPVSQPRNQATATKSSPVATNAAPDPTAPLPEKSDPTAKAQALRAKIMKETGATVDGLKAYLDGCFAKNPQARGNSTPDTYLAMFSSLDKLITENPVLVDEFKANPKQFGVQFSENQSKGVVS